MSREWNLNRSRERNRNQKLRFGFGFLYLANLISGIGTQNFVESHHLESDSQAPGIAPTLAGTQVYGLFLLVCGLMIVNDMRLFSHFLESRMFWPPYFITFNGFMMALLALFGLYATYNRNYKLLFAISALIVLLVEIAIVTTVSTEISDYKENIKRTMEPSLQAYPFQNIDRKAWSYIQRKLKCCGIERPQDWGVIYARSQVPASCCARVPDQADALCIISPDPEIIHQYGCHQILVKRLNDHWSVLSLLAALAALLQVVILVLSILMAFLVKREKRAREKQ
ncbi:CD63 antigen-like isoform X2 [Planococcus citri]|uniref:CD63 antigen-like isoform X2 n=1 Tax=Planococcus citri TaxID=170843 RepID=UPI0031F74DD7